MSDQSTNWYLKLMDLVSNPLKKIMDAAGGAQKKINELNNSTKKITDSQNAMGRDLKRNLGQLNTLLDGLRDRQARSFNTKHIEAYNRMIQKTESEIKKIHASTNLQGASTSMFAQLKGDLSGLVNQLPGLQNGLSLLKNPLALVATAILSIGTASGNLALNFENGMAKVNATAQLGAKQLSVLDDRLTEIGADSGGNFERIPDTYERILSITGKVNQSLDLTELAVKGAKAGFTDLDVVGNALARTMNVIEDKTLSAASVLDMLMMAKNVGAGDFKDFAQYLPGLIASAQPAGYGAKDTVGLFSTLSKSFEGSQAATYTENLFTAFKKTDIIYGLEKAGVKVFKNGFRRPIGDVLMDLAELKSKLNPEQFTNFMDAIKLKDAQAATAIGAIVGNVDALKTVVDGLNNSLGETDRQLSATASTGRTWKEVGDLWKSIGKGIGDYLLPPLELLGNALISIGRGFKELFGGTIFQKSTWRNESDDAIKQAARQKNASKIALARTQEHFKLAPGQNPDFRDAAQLAFFNSIYKQNAAFSSDKNKIVSDKQESKGTAKGKALFNANAGISMANDAMAENKTGGTGSSSSGSASTGNKAPNAITMNLTVNNHFKTNKDDDVAIKRKITDLIVDSARDAAVTIGM